MSNIKTLTYPQVAILWWNESKQSHADYFSSPFFTDPDSRYYVTNGQLVLVVGQSKNYPNEKDFKIRMSNYSPKQGFYAHPDNLIFLGEL